MEKLRPEHYEKSEDTFSWSEKKYSRDICICIAEFNIHKYLNRDKNDDYKDFGKIIDYANWARKLMEKEKNECIR